MKLQLIDSYISTCCGKSDGLSHDELRAVSSAQIAILHKTSSSRELKYVKKRWIKIRIPELMVHLEHNLFFQATHSLLLLRYESIRKNVP